MTVFFSSVTQAAVSVRDAAGAVREVAQNILKVNICNACRRAKYNDHADLSPELIALHTSIHPNQSGIWDFNFQFIVIYSRCTSL